MGAEWLLSWLFVGIGERVDCEVNVGHVTEGGEGRLVQREVVHVHRIYRSVSEDLGSEHNVITYIVLAPFDPEQ